MRTSLNEIKEIEEHLQGNSAPEESLVFEARMILLPELRQKVSDQKKVYHQIQLYGRKKLRAEIEAVHVLLFTQTEHKSFRDKIYRLFSKT